MAIKVSGSGQASGSMLDVFDGSGFGKAAPTAAVYKSGIVGAFGGLLEMFWPVSAGAAFGQGFAPNGLPGMFADSAVAQINSLGTNYGMPIAQNIVGAPVIPLALARPLRRYHFSVIAWSELLNANPFAVQVQANGSGDFNQWAAACGLELVSDSTINGGNWTLRARRTNAGALTILGTVPISPLNNPQVIEFDYIEGQSPTASVRVGGNLVASIGIAALPILPIGAVQFAPKITQGLNPGGVAGRRDWFSNARFQIIELS